MLRDKLSRLFTAHSFQNLKRNGIKAVQALNHMSIGTCNRLKATHGLIYKIVREFPKSFVLGEA
jgi:hypothetical protein